MVRILTNHPDRLAPRLVIQPNDVSAILRFWGRRNGYHLAEEVVAGETVVLVFVRAPGPDPAYAPSCGVPYAWAEEFGPHLIRRRCPHLKRWLEGLQARRHCPRRQLVLDLL